ncbi:MAG: 50S ribosomal protein L4 [Patescibacteria group bacterium]
MKTKKTNTLSAPVLGVDGKAKGRMQLPPELFGAKINKQLLAQAVRVYLSNQRAGTASTKTRGQVEGSTRKIYRQKGTGRARHGSIRAPIFVGGGIVFGPHPRDYRLELPKKAKRAALAAALTSQFSKGNIVIVDGLSELPPKTKEMAKTLHTVGATGKTLLATGGEVAVTRAARNIADVDVMLANNLYAYAVLSHQKVVLTKDAISTLRKHV